MTLIITAIAAIVATIIRFAKSEVADRFHLGFLSLMFWGATLMWCVDGFACLAEGEPFVELVDTAAMADDALLGLCVVVLELVVWGIVCVTKQPKAPAIA